MLATLKVADSSFLFFERMTAEAKLLLKHLTDINPHDSLAHFYTQINVQELLCLVFR